MRKALVLLLALAACSKSEKDTGVTKDPVYPDVPAHSGMTYVEGKGTGGKGFRSATQTYRGEAKVEDVLAFYRKAMPENGWVARPESGADAVTLTFVKENEKCEIRVSTDSHNKTVVTVELSYKS